MLSIEGIYENGRIHFLEPLPFLKRAKVIVTVLEELETLKDEYEEADINLFDDLVGIVDICENGSAA
ncbi:Uncharacterized protein dnl_54750 [Desulfonema limicola]|uniref:Uncharacterized protein n=1 Tax=Desulfonema limicola TaxID=45656 RepID=A0A975GIZ9_9BACT|nr:hypothetical protein [Desulfonema limicola]QTA83082.1 Uncharacterized protein dnl_54750 [Desulfonema limicola]